MSGSFQCASFQAASFQTNCPPVTAGGGRRYRRHPIPIIDPRMHDDELALLLLEAD